jgi:hypothetical protein
MAYIITNDVMSQARQKRSDVFLITTKRGEPWPNEPAPGCERFKIGCDTKVEISDFKMYLREYQDGEKAHDAFEEMYFTQISKGNKLVWEVVPDVSTTNLLKIFVYFPGFVAHRIKTGSIGKQFKYAPYLQTENTMQADEVPLMLFYEDDVATGEMEKLVKQHMTDSKLNPNAAKNKLPLSKIKRYAILSYRLN